MKMIAAVFLFLILAGCGEGGIFDTDCDGERKDLVRDYGEPDELQKYDASGYHSHSYWYWKRGFSRTFVWGDDVGNCEISDYTFSPIR